MSDSEITETQRNAVHYYDSTDSEVEHEGDLNEEELQRKNIRDNLSTLSFEELLKLKETLGSKVYNNTVFGDSPHSLKPIVKRENKNRPREVSSKIRPKQLRSILSKNSFTTAKFKQSTPRDPRFDPSVGEFDKATFKHNYQFLSDIRNNEKVQLQKELAECTDGDRKKTIKLLIQRIENQIREEERSNKERNKEDTEKKQIREKLKRGETPIYKNKSVKKLENLVEKYEELKNTNRLQKHLQKRAKKLKVKDRKTIAKIKQ